jgi:hypothetical protein
MDRRITYVLLIALVVLIGLAWLLDANILEPVTPEAGSTTPTVAPLWTVDPASINLIRIEDLKNGTHVEVQKNLQGSWLVMDLPAVAAETTAMDTAATNMAKLIVNRDYGVGLKAAEFNLDPPNYLLTVKTATGYSYELEIGALNPTGTGYYVRLKTDPNRIVGVSNALLSGIIGWLTSKPIPATITPTFTITPTSTATPTETAAPSATPTLTPTGSPTLPVTPGTMTVTDTPGTPVPSLTPTPTS